MPEIGSKAPLFTLPDHEGNEVSLSDFKGKKVVLYFYPKDNTPGCTKEACSFRDNLARVTARGAKILGISADGMESHLKFRKKFDLPFPLLSDEKREVVDKYDVWKKKSLYGRSFMGIQRTTYIIDEKGIVRHVFPKVKVEGHIDEVLHVLSQMQ